MIRELNFSGIDEFVVGFLLISFAALVIAWAFAVWEGTAWLLRNRKRRPVAVVICVFPVLFATMQFFGFPEFFSVWLQMTWMLTVARVVAPLLTDLASESRAIQGTRM